MAPEAHDLSKFETDPRKTMGAHMFRAPFSPQVLLLGTVAWGLFRGGVEVLGRLVDDTLLWPQFIAAFFERIVPVPASLYHGQPGFGDHIAPEVFAAILAWGVGLWALFGIAIARTVAEQIAKRETPSVRASLAFAWQTKWSNLAYPFVALTALALLWSANALAGLLFAIPVVGPLLFLPALPFVILFTLVFTLLALGAIVGVGIATAGLATERNGTLDAVSRVYDYSFREPIYVLFSTTMLLLFAKLLLWVGNGVFLPAFEASLATLLTSDSSRTVLDAAFQRPSFAPRTLTGVEPFAAAILGFVVAALRLVIGGAVVAVVISAATSIYFRLRFEIDRVGFDEIDLGLRTDPSMTGIPGNGAAGDDEKPNGNGKEHEKPSEGASTGESKG